MSTIGSTTAESAKKCLDMERQICWNVITVGDFSGAINKRSYTLAETSVNLVTGEVSVTPEAPI